MQLKTVLDNADGQLARLSGRITPFGRYLDSELDLLVNAALFAALGWVSGQPVLAAAGFVALTSVLSANYNVERLYRAEHGEPGSRDAGDERPRGRTPARAVRPRLRAARQAGRALHRMPAARRRSAGAPSPTTTGPR